MADGKAARDKDSSIKDIYSYFTTVRDPETGELALTPDDVRRNTGNFIIAGKYHSIFQDLVLKTDLARFRYNR